MKHLSIQLAGCLLLIGLLLLCGCNKTPGPTTPELAPMDEVNTTLHKPGFDCTPAPSDLISWWPFDETGGATAEDIAGENEASIVGATPIVGMVDGALNFDGIDDCVMVPDDPSLDITSQISIDAWIKPDNVIGEHAIVNKQPSGYADYNHAGNYEFGLFGTKLVFKSQFAPFNRTEAHSPNMDLAAGQWYFVAVTADAVSKVVKFYVNGNLVDTIIWQYSLLQFTNDEPLRIGRRKDGLFFDGIIDEVEVYNRVLAGNELQAIFNAGAAGKCKFIPVEIDIKPGSDPNSINCKNQNGVIPVAILTTNMAAGESIDFDATTVDPLTVRFGRTGTEAVETHGTGHIEDVDGDGDLDMVLHFRFGETGILCDDTEAILTGKTNDSKPLQGKDAIRTVGSQ
jgi:hypothetical protein